MNHLAHIFLAGRTVESLIGNLAGDFVKGTLGVRFTPGIRRGIAEHRRIDSFTDTHPAMAAFRSVLTPGYGHYGRVIADVFVDHFLASFWTEFATIPLDEFAAGIFATLDPHVSSMPGQLPHVYTRMRDDGWLQSYAGTAGIWTALYHLSRRFSRRPHLEGATRHLIDDRKELERRFREFFPDAVAFANALRSEE